MNVASRERLQDVRRNARVAALAKARRARLREIAMVEQYLAQARWSQGSLREPRVWPASQPRAWLLKRPD
jgi:hypothetical protein